MARAAAASRTSASASPCCCDLCLLILLPYFNFVFAYLNPISIVDRISAHTLEVIGKQGAADLTIANSGGARRGAASDVAVSAMEHRDRASRWRVNALRQRIVDYQGVRPHCRPTGSSGRRARAQPGLRVAGCARAGGPRRAQDLVRDEGAAPVPTVTARLCTAARHQLRDRDQHAPLEDRRADPSAAP